MPRHPLVPFDDTDPSERAPTVARSTFPGDRIRGPFVVDAHADDTAAIGC